MKTVIKAFLPTNLQTISLAVLKHAIAKLGLYAA